MLISGSLCYNFDCLDSIVVTVYGQSMILLTIFIRYLHPSLPLLMYMYTSHSHNECFLAPIYIAIHWTYSGCPFLTVVRIIPHLERADLFWMQTLKQQSQMPFVEDLAIGDLLVYRVYVIFRIHEKIAQTGFGFSTPLLFFHQFSQDFRTQLFKKRNV